jgi:putative flippase GtrA
MKRMLKELTLDISEKARYVLASALCLILDIMALKGLSSVGFENSAAAVMAYALGLWVHYLLAIKWVFVYRRLKDETKSELTAYLVTGLLGMMINYGIIYIGDQLGVLLRYSKGVAIIVSFVVVYLIRKNWLFLSQAAPERRY